MKRNNTSNLKHIVVIQNTTLSENYGLSSYLRNIITTLAQHPNLKISLICLHGDLNKTTCPTNVDLYEVEGSTYTLKGNLFFFWKTFYFLKAINKKNKIDLVHCLYPNSSVAGAVLYKLIYGNIKILYDLRSPWIHISIERGSINKVIAPIYKLIAYTSEYILSLFVDKFIFITDGLFNFYKGKLRLKNKPFAIIPSGIDIDFFRSKPQQNIRSLYNISVNDIVIGHVGAVSSLRHLNEVIRAFADIPNKAQGYKFIIVGSGDDKEKLENLVMELKIEDKVIFTGQVNQESVRDYLHAFDVGICHLPDTFVFRQSSPMKVLEYLALGLPVLASDILTHRELSDIFKKVVIYKNNNLVLKFEDVKKISKKYPEKLASYDWKNITVKIITLYF